MKNFKTQLKATLAMAKADLIATFRNGSSVFFGILFPMIFIAVFGFIGGGDQKFEVAVLPDTDRENPVYETVEKIEVLELTDDRNSDEIKAALERGDIAAAFGVTKSDNGAFKVTLQKSLAEAQSSATIEGIITGVVDKLNLAIAGVENPPVQYSSVEVSGRKFKQIDYVLPGQLGFALLSSGIFGTAFLFVSLRQTLVIKRFFATPVKKYSIVIGEAISKLTFALIQASVIILIGKFAFDFTLVHGVETFFTMLLLSALGLLVFLGMGFVVSSLAKDENSVPAIANLLTMPQFLLAGTFFPIELFPEWLQPISKVLPLTYLNNAMRDVAFEGASLLDVSREIGIILIAGIVVYALAIRVFKWEA